MNELVSPEGLRSDGRRPDEHRALSSRLGVVGSADGSAVLRCGATVVMAAIFGPHSSGSNFSAQAVPHHSHEFHVRISGKDSEKGAGPEAASSVSSQEQSAAGSSLHARESAAAVTQAQLARLQTRATINCEFAEAPFAGTERRRGGIGRPDQGMQDVAMVIRDTFDQAVLAHLMPRAQLDIRVQVLQSDGGMLCTAINAVTLALVHAGIPLEDMVCACSVAAIGSSLLVDPNQLEVSSGGSELPVAIMAASGRVVTTMMESKMPLDQFETALNLAVRACNKVHQILEEQLEVSLLKHSLSEGAQLNSADSPRRRAFEDDSEREGAGDVEMM